MTKDEAWVLEEKYDGKKIAAFEKDRARLAEGEPVAYVIGWQPFLGLRIYLDSRPLIPRPETEWWTEKLLTTLKETDGDLTLLDLCAGSGAIGCAFLRALPTAHVYVGEIDAAHQKTIEKNIQENNLDASRAHIGIGDLFAPFGAQTFDIIACNPPYIPEKRTLPESVRAYEPKEALFSGTDGLSLIREIAKQLPRHLNKGGAAWIECDTAHIENAQTLFESAGFSTHIQNDQYATARVVVVTWS